MSQGVWGRSRNGHLLHSTNGHIALCKPWCNRNVEFPENLIVGLSEFSTCFSQSCTPSPWGACRGRGGYDAGLYDAKFQLVGDIPGMVNGIHTLPHIAGTDMYSKALGIVTVKSINYYFDYYHGIDTTPDIWTHFVWDKWGTLLPEGWTDGSGNVRCELFVNYLFNGGSLAAQLAGGCDLNDYPQGGEDYVDPEFGIIWPAERYLVCPSCGKWIHVWGSTTTCQLSLQAMVRGLGTCDMGISLQSNGSQLWGDSDQYDVSAWPELSLAGGNEPHCASADHSYKSCYSYNGYDSWSEMNLQPELAVGGYWSLTAG